MRIIKTKRFRKRFLLLIEDEYNLKEEDFELYRKELLQNLTPKYLKEKLKEIRKVLFKQISDFKGVWGDCGNFAIALARILNGFYVCSYRNEENYLEGDPDHCATLWCPNLNLKNYHQCKMLWDIDGNLTFKKIEDIPYFFTKNRDAIIIKIYTDLENPIGIKNIYDENRSKLIETYIWNILWTFLSYEASLI